MLLGMGSTAVAPDRGTTGAAPVTVGDGAGRRHARVPRHRWRRSAGAALPYLVTGLLSAVVVGLISAAVSRTVAEEQAIDGAIAMAGLAASAAVAPVLTDAVPAGDPAALAALDRAVRDDVLNVSMRRVKIWDATGRIVYSDEPRLIGERFALDADELDVLGRTGGAEAEVSDLSAPENRFEEPAVELLEVYLSMRTPAGTPVLFEVYSRYDGVSEAASRIWRSFLPLGIGALLLLELLQLPIAAVLSRRLRRAHAQREETVRRSLAAVDEERGRIARDLHDGVVQDLAGVAFTLAAATRRARSGPVDPEPLEAATARIRRSVRSLRSLVVEIYPPDLHDAGLPAALTDLVERVLPPSVHATVDVGLVLPPLREELVELAFRVAQEGLRNVVRHARARTVLVSLRRSGPVLVLEVADDGVGCDPARLDGRPGHLGLRALAGLATASGAALAVETGPGSGTTLILELPVEWTS